jgi:O-phospho-L-seryl-tRNASec:L-selenocysteinyl-tRNA synthase
LDGVGRIALFSRIDQKSCIKAMLAAGLEVKVIENVMEGHELRTNIEAIEEAIQFHGAENIFCVVTTTSCFAPRACDRVEEVSRICKSNDIPHVINNAYGLQTTKCTSLIDRACRSGRVDAIIQSTDKNFLVPVGGSIVASPNPHFIKSLSQVSSSLSHTLSNLNSHEIFLTHFSPTLAVPRCLLC